MVEKESSNDEIIIPFKGTGDKQLPPKGLFKRRLARREKRRRKAKRNHVCLYCRKSVHNRLICEQRIRDNEFLVKGTDGQGWNDIWFASLLRKFHVCSNKDLFKNFKQTYGIETMGYKKGVVYMQGFGRVDVHCMGKEYEIESVYYTPKLGKNVLSVDQLTQQGFEVMFEGSCCTIKRVFDKTHDTKKEVEGEKVGNDMFIEDYFKALDLETTKEHGEGKQPVLEEKEVENLNDMIIFLDLLGAVNDSLKKEERVKSKFKGMVKWYVKKCLKQKSSFPPRINGQEVDLYDLYMVININGGKKACDKEAVWPLIAADLGLNSMEFIKLKLVYNEYLSMMEERCKKECFHASLVKQVVKQKERIVM